MTKGYISDDPATKVDNMRVEKKLVYVPPIEDIYKVLSVATQEQSDYLRCLVDTFIQ